MPETLRLKFSKSLSIDFDVKEEHRVALSLMQRPIIVIDKSIEQHCAICVENSEDLPSALKLVEQLNEEIEFRVRVYSRCLSKTSESYVIWLRDEYLRKLKNSIMRTINGLA